MCICISLNIYLYIFCYKYSYRYILLKLIHTLKILILNLMLQSFFFILFFFIHYLIIRNFKNNYRVAQLINVIGLNNFTRLSSSSLSSEDAKPSMVSALLLPSHRKLSLPHFRRPASRSNTIRQGVPLSAANNSNFKARA